MAYPDPNVPPVETSTALFGDVVDAVDKERQKELSRPPITYRFGGRVVKRQRNMNPYQE
jgi:hypothetical protein